MFEHFFYEYFLRNWEMRCHRHFTWNVTWRICYCFDFDNLKILVAPSLGRKMTTVIPEFESGVFVFLGTFPDLARPKHHIFWISVKKRFFWCIAYQAPRTSNMFSISKKSSSELALFTSLWQSFFVNSLKLLSFNKFQVQGVNQHIFFYLLEPLWI